MGSHLACAPRLSFATFHGAQASCGPTIPRPRLRHVGSTLRAHQVWWFVTVYNTTISFSSRRVAPCVRTTIRGLRRFMAPDGTQTSCGPTKSRSRFHYVGSHLACGPRLEVCGVVRHAGELPALRRAGTRAGGPTGHHALPYGIQLLLRSW